jgi:phosphoribosylaminoimidazole-succinocarboxamide synthase
MTLKGLKLIKQGKVRDLYRTESGILMVASDRISAFDVVLPTPIPHKGAVLTGLSVFWFDHLKDVVTNHLISTNPDDFPPEAKEHADALRGRTMLVKPAEVVPVECVARGYLSGSGWKDYRDCGAVCGIRLPAGLQESEQLPEPIFTPTTKADEGHDMPLTFGEACDLVGRETAERIRDLTLTLYARAAAYALDRGIIIADTKFEFGTIDGEITLIDEALTPDSSRFWPADEYKAGGAVPSFDKQYVRDYLDSTGWDHSPPGPELPETVVEQTRKKYVDAYERITRKSFQEWIA